MDGAACHYDRTGEMRRDSLTRWLGAVGVLGAIVFWAALAVLHDLRPDLSVLDAYVSD